MNGQIEAAIVAANGSTESDRHQWDQENEPELPVNRARATYKPATDGGRARV